MLDVIGSIRTYRDDTRSDEAALYDRQIRLWGVEAQQR